MYTAVVELIRTSRLSFISENFYFIMPTTFSKDKKAGTQKAGSKDSAAPLRNAVEGLFLIQNIKDIAKWKETASEVLRSEYGNLVSEFNGVRVERPLPAPIAEQPGGTLAERKVNYQNAVARHSKLSDADDEKRAKIIGIIQQHYPTEAWKRLSRDNETAIRDDKLHVVASQMHPALLKCSVMTKEEMDEMINKTIYVYTNGKKKFNRSEMVIDKVQEYQQQVLALYTSFGKPHPEWSTQLYHLVSAMDGDLVEMKGKYLNALKAKPNLHDELLSEPQEEDFFNADGVLNHGAYLRALSAHSAVTNVYEWVPKDINEFTHWVRNYQFESVETKGSQALMSFATLKRDFKDLSKSDKKEKSVKGCWNCGSKDHHALHCNRRESIEEYLKAHPTSRGQHKKKKKQKGGGKVQSQSPASSSDEE